MNAIGIVLAVLMPLQQMAWDSVNKRMANADPATDRFRFVNYPVEFTTRQSKFGEHKLNPRFWLKGVDFSCASPWNSGGGRVRAGTAISKRHIVFSKHFPLWKNVRIVFVGEDGGECPCYIEATKEIDQSDIVVGLLNAELTSNIKPAKILPPDYVKYIGDGAGMPVVLFNQHEQVVLSSLQNISTNGVKPYAMRCVAPGDRSNDPFRKAIVGGDSGNPAFLLIGNEAILLFCLQGGGCGSGSALHLYRHEIQQAMNNLCPGYKLETFDFSRLIDRN